MAGRRIRERDADEYPEDDARRDERTDGPPPLSAAEAATMASRLITELTNRDTLGVTSVEPTEDGWSVGVEVVEEARIPSSSDMLALYQAEIDPDGMLLSYRRTRRYPRGRSDVGR